MSNALLNHPMFSHANEMIEICHPLNKLNINYFSHVFLDKNKNFSILSNNPKFMEIYFSKKYFNADIHTGNFDRFGHYVVWDNVPRSGKTLAMAEDAAELNIKHTFTIIQKIAEGTHFYHFSSPVESSTINQAYLSNLELLTYFINHFNDRIKNSRSLGEACNQKFSIDDSAEGYTLEKNDALLLEDNIYSDFKSNLKIPQLSQREEDCLLLTTQGKSAKEIAAILGISFRTVETHLEKTKLKFRVNSKSSLIEKWVDLHYLSDKPY